MFKRFADRHGLRYEVQTDVPVELCWEFPGQPKLSVPIVLGLQNGDVLNFAVSDFYSHFYPFPNVIERFEDIIDAWVEGNARMAVTGKHARMLQVREGESWQTVYRANEPFFPFRRKPRTVLYNEPKR